MTEEEAKTKACCAGLGFGHHQQPTMPTGAACIASLCMAWRWASRKSVVNNSWNCPDSDPPYGPWEQRQDGAWQSVSKTPEGYCGLAGKP